MSTPSITLEGTDKYGQEVNLSLRKELSLHGEASTMATLQLGTERILLTISDLRVISTIAEKLADALEFGGE